MNQLKIFLILLLLVLLPHHGAITVFGPDWMRWWKEGVLLLLGVLSVYNIQHAVNSVRKQFAGENLVDLCTRVLKSPESYALLFLLWASILVAINPDPHTALVAFRYLGLGYVVFLIIQYTTCSKQYSEQLITHSFIISLFVSVLFGFWAHFLGGYEVLTAWYSNTISSWVPGQTIPLYHESDGIIRMQGTASGPIEFSHLLVVGVFLLLFQYSVFSIQHTRNQKLKAIHTFAYWLILALFLLAIYFSHSRAAMIAVVVLLVGKLFQSLRGQDWKQFRIILVGGIIGGVLSAILGLSFAPSLIDRAGTSDHITRPIEAVKSGLENPLTGCIGSWGPAARAKNLETKNDDKAPIAENVFADYFAQLGILGVILGLGFFWSLWRRFDYEGRVFLITVFVLLNLATVLDMSPVSIGFFFWLACLKNTKKLKC